MLITRAPMRLSFAGGGTDIPQFYETHGGMVVSTAIDKYVYVFISQTGVPSLQISSSDYSTFIRHEGDEDVEEIGRLRYARVFMRTFGIRSGYSVFIASEMPPGTGLGSSSALSVALTKSLSVLRGDLPGKAAVADRAAQIEIERLGMPIGKQDHYASAFGGINAFYFSAAGVEVEPLNLSPAARQRLAESTLTFFTDQSHSSAEILSEQTRRSSADPAVIRSLQTILEHAKEVRQALIDDEVDCVGEILHRTWAEKKKLAAGISNSMIDHAYDEALNAGALGGKIAGAGGGGFLLIMCPPERRAAVSSAMKKCGLIPLDWGFNEGGARVLVNNATN
jgi:D-glycero-alpha-D-manno-heptose-7-phosphate kinase